MSFHQESTTVDVIYFPLNNDDNTKNNHEHYPEIIGFIPKKLDHSKLLLEKIDNDNDEELEGNLKNNSFPCFA